MNDPYALSLVETEYGKFWLPLEANDYVANVISRGEIYEADVVEVGKKYIQPGSWVVDAGCGYGQMSVLFARAGAKVLTLEPNPLLAYVAGRTFATNNLPIRLYVGAAWKSRDLLRFPYCFDSEKHRSLCSYGLGEEEGWETFGVCIDDFELEPVSFLKVDCQGSDLNVLEGARKTIARCRMPIVVEVEPETNLPQFQRFFSWIRYDLSRLGQWNYLGVPQ